MIRVYFNHRFICNENAVELAGMTNGNNYMSSCSLVVPYFSLVYILLYFRRDRERRKIRFARAEIFSKPSLYHRGEGKSLEIKKQISWKLLATWGKKSNQVNVAVLFQDTF